MKKIDFERAINKCSNKDCILIGKNIELFKLKEDIDLELIKDRVPLPFSEINSIIKKHFKHINYIDFWTGIEIYE